MLQPLSVKFTGEVIIPRGEAEVKVDYRGQTSCLPLLVTLGRWPGLLGHNWFSDLNMNWKELATPGAPGYNCNGPVSQLVLGAAGET